jgi:hypothetical protein
MVAFQGSVAGCEGLRAGACGGVGECAWWWGDGGRT